MISVIIPTLNDARRLPRTLASLYPAALEGIVSQVVVSDGGSSDLTLAMAQEAGCDIVSGEAGNAARLIRGAGLARGRWLLFLRAGTSLEDGWSAEALRFLNAGDESRAAAFRSGFWSAVVRRPRAEQGLLISRELYDALGGFDEREDIVRRIGARRLATLKARLNNPPAD